MGDNIEGLIVLLLRERNSADAVRLYEEETGADRASARRSVQAIARRHGLSRRGRPLILAAACGIIALGVLALWRLM